MRYTVICFRQINQNGTSDSIGSKASFQVSVVRNKACWVLYPCLKPDNRVDPCLNCSYLDKYIVILQIVAYCNLVL